MKKIVKHIALTLKALRQERGWSLDKTAQETGVSKAMLGQIEREESSPTIATLWKIANGFNTSFSFFLENKDIPTQKTLYRSQPLPYQSSMDDKMKVIPLFPFDEQLHCEIFILELLPGCQHLSLPHQSGVIEHVIVIEGTLEIFLNGIWQILKKDEGLRFSADQPHGYRNTTKNLARFQNMIHYSENNRHSSRIL